MLELVANIEPHQFPELVMGPRILPIGYGSVSDDVVGV
ncbi:MAG: hypothetical protein ACI92G_004261 [Candidatus Pelagisphaera sp.]|jgi:hypothetical protein